MRIALKEDYTEGGNVKTTVRRSKGTVVFWNKGQEIEVSEATGRKLIAAGKATEVADGKRSK